MAGGPTGKAFVYDASDGSDVAEFTLTQENAFINDATFELNGIAPAGRRLIAVQSRTGLLFEIDPRSGDTEEIDLGGETLTAGDGLLRQGKLLYVVQNRLNQVAVVDLRRGEIVRTITDSDFAVPTTVARKGKYLWLPNARFGMPPSTDDERDVVRVSR